MRVWPLKDTGGVMDIKNSAITAKMVIHSLLALLENENVDISSVKFKVGSDGNGYESPEFELEKLVSLAIDGLVEIEDAGAVPEGFVWMPKEPTQEMLDAFPEVEYEDTYAGACSILIDNQTLKIGYKAMIEAQEPAND